MASAASPRSRTICVVSSSSLAFMESLTIYGLVIALVLLFANPLIK
jgi:F0F1-type ATP synthase membrane subunit c/vacuolar-type H+-ATPase subunit K